MGRARSTGVPWFIPQLIGAMGALLLGTRWILPRVLGLGSGATGEFPAVAGMVVLLAGTLASSLLRSGSWSPSPRGRSLVRYGAAGISVLGCAVILVRIVTTTFRLLAASRPGGTGLQLAELRDAGAEFSQFGMFLIFLGATLLPLGRRPPAESS